MTVDPRALAAFDALVARPLVYRDALGHWVVSEDEPERPGRFAVFSGPEAEGRARRYAAWIARQS